MILTFSARPLGKRGALATPGKSYDIPFLSIQKFCLFRGGAPDTTAVRASPTNVPDPNFAAVRKLWRAP